MDFDKFIERDIIEFLDQEARKTAEKVAGLREEEFDLYEITQDYTKEIDSALKKRDLKKAQDVFEEVKERYDKATEGSLSKKRLYIILEELYEKIKDFEEKEKGEETLFEKIREYEEKGLFTKPELFQEESHAVSLILSSIARKEKELEKLTSKKPVSSQDLKEAIKKYREIKELIRRMPNTHAKEKSKAYESALSWYYTIKKLKQEAEQKIRREEEEKKEKEKKSGEEIPIEKKLEAVRELKKAIVESHTKIAEYIKNKDLAKSMEEYKHLRELCESFPQEMEAEKTALLADALSLYENIKKLKQHLAQRHSRECVKKKEAEKEKNEREEKKQEIKKKLLKIKEYLAQKRVIHAIKEYKDLRELFKDYPDQHLEEKKELYQEILATHKDIKLLEEDLKKKIIPHVKEKAGGIKKILEETHALLDKGRVEEATHKLLEAKHRTQMLPKEAFDEKYSLLKELEKLEHKLLFVKNTQRMSILNATTS